MGRGRHAISGLFMTSSCRGMLPVGEHVEITQFRVPASAAIKYWLKPVCALEHADSGFSKLCERLRHGDL